MASTTFINYQTVIDASWLNDVNNLTYNGVFQATAVAAPPAWGTVTPNTGAFTTLSASSTVSGTGFSTYLASPPAIGGTAPSTGKFTSVTDTNLTSGRVTYATTGGLLTDSANMTFDGTTLTATGLSGPHNGTVGATTPSTGAFTTLSASSTVSGTGFSTYLASPPAIGGTTAAAGSFTTLSASSTVTFSGGTANGVLYLNGSKVATSGSALVFDGTNLGLGVNPSAWGSSYKAIQIGGGNIALSSNGAGSGDGSLTWNGYYNGTNWVYSYTGGVSSRFRLNELGASWFIAPSGTAGNAITFTQAMTLDASGNLGIGTSSPSYRLDVASAASTGIVARYTTTTGVPTYISSYGSTGGIFAESGGNNGWGYNASSNYIVSFTNGSERMRIDSSGDLYLGTSASLAGRTRFNLAGVTSSINGFGIRNASDSGTIYSIYFQNASGTLIGSINNNGSNTSYVTSSDYRLKENVAPMTGALNTIAQLKPVTYKWKSNGSDGQGFIAHELQAVVPDCVTGEKDAVDEEGNPKYQGIDTSFLVATLTAAIQEQQAIIQSLTARIETLENK